MQEVFYAVGEEGIGDYDQFLLWRKLNTYCDEVSAANAAIKVVSNKSTSEKEVAVTQKMFA